MAPTTAFGSVPLILLLSFGLFCSLVFFLPFLFPQISHIFLRDLEDERRRFAVILGTEWGPAADLPIIQSEVSQKEKHQMSFF